MQNVWSTILDDDFLYAYTYGIVIECIDGAERRVYPRIFTYSADYPEKSVQFLLPNAPLLNSLFRISLACIRENGLYPCHRCLIHKQDIQQLGLDSDVAIRIKGVRTFLSDQVTKARNFIYRRSKPINGVDVEDLLKETSSVPTMVRY